MIKGIRLDTTRKQLSFCDVFVCDRCLMKWILNDYWSSVNSDRNDVNFFNIIVVCFVNQFCWYCVEWFDLIWLMFLTFLCNVSLLLAIEALISLSKIILFYFEDVVQLHELQFIEIASWFFLIDVMFFFFFVEFMWFLMMFLSLS